MVLRSVKRRRLDRRPPFLHVNWSLSLGYQSCFSWPLSTLCQPQLWVLPELVRRAASLHATAYSSWFRVASEDCLGNQQQTTASTALPWSPGTRPAHLKSCTDTSSPGTLPHETHKWKPAGFLLSQVPCLALRWLSFSQEVGAGRPQFWLSVPGPASAFIYNLPCMHRYGMIMHYYQLKWCLDFGFCFLFCFFLELFPTNMHWIFLPE